MNKYISLLTGLGLPEKWAQLYLSLIQHGESSIAQLATSCDFHRMEVYRFLPIMLDSGLVLETKKGKRKTYTPTHPNAIQELYQQQIEHNSSSIDQLTQQFSYIWKRPKVIYQEGKKWISYVFSDIINTLWKGEVFYRVSSEKDVKKANSYLPKDYRKKRDTKQLERYVIMSESWATNKVPRLERELVTIPKEFDDFWDNISMTLYKNKIAYIDFSTQTSIIIEQKELVSFQKKLFILLFKSLRK